MSTPKTMMSKGKKCKHNGGYTEGYICRMCKKPIYTKEQIEEIETMQKTPIAKPNRCKNCMVRFNGIIKVKDVRHPHCADCDRCIDGRCYAFPPIPSLPPAKANRLQDVIRQILTPPEPRDATYHGGVVSWKASWTKEGLDIIVFRIMEAIRKAQSEIEPKLSIPTPPAEREKYHPDYKYSPDVCRHGNLETVGNGKACYDCGAGFYSSLFPLDFMGKDYSTPPAKEEGWTDEFYTFISALEVSKFSPEVQRKFIDFIHSLRSQACKEGRREIVDFMRAMVKGNDCASCTLEERILEQLDALKGKENNETIL